LKSYGYTDVQPYHTQWDDPVAMHDLLQKVGLTAKSGHFTLEMLRGEFDRVVAASRTLDLALVVAPFVQPQERASDRAGWRAFGAELAEISKRLADAGLDFAWHNHTFEFEALPDGSYPIEHILGDDLSFEIDVAWVARSGTDPGPWLERYKGRIPAIHVKDLAVAGEKTDEGGWADVGTGVIPWAELWRPAVATGAWLMVAEHDKPSDYKRFARVSADAIRSLAGVA
jgi:sugar phosphate isomerase/epimerase